MRKTVQIVFPLLLIVIFAVGCENDQTTVLTSPTSSNDLVLTLDKAQVGSLNSLDVDTLGLTLEFLDSLEYEEFAGQLLPGYGAILTGEMKTWPGGCLFGINVRPESLPSGLENPVTFSMRIPTYQSYVDYPNLPLIIRLEPSDINFIEPVGVLGTYMPWTGLTAEDVFKYFCLLPEFTDYGEPSVDQVDRYVRIMFNASHFSIWGVGGGAADNKGQQLNKPANDK